MQVTIETVLAAAMQLPVNDRLELASHLLEADTPDDGLFDIDDPALLEEIERRFADGSEGIPWHVLREERGSVEL